MPENGVLVAAIRGATKAMANAGMLNHRPDTSNSLDYLKMMFPGRYQDEAHDVQQQAVTDDPMYTFCFDADFRSNVPGMPWHFWRRDDPSLRRERRST